MAANEPDGNWLLNHYHAMIASEAGYDASFVADCGWAFEGCGGIPIDLKAYYPAAWEANGNCLRCHRGTGELLFFAPDHACDDLVPYGNCPEYTLYKKVNAATFSDWAERIAAQWLAFTE